MIETVAIYKEEEANCHSPDQYRYNKPGPQAQFPTRVSAYSNTRDEQRAWITGERGATTVEQEQRPANEGGERTRCRHSLSIVLPTYNEEHIISVTLEHVLHVLPTWVKDFEIIVVNDGSSDRTGAIVSAIAKVEPRVRIIPHARNQGYGSALADGFAAATKELTFFMDSDGQFDIRDLARLLPFIDQFDAVIGYRLHRQDTWMRKFNAWGWKCLIGWMLSVHVRDIDCAFKLFRSNFLHQHPPETRGAMINAELLYRLKRTGYTYREVGVHHLPRRGGRATGANLRVIARAFHELFSSARQWRREERANPLLTSAVWSTIPVLANEAASLPVAGPGGQSGGGLRRNSTVDSALISYLETHRGSAKYLVAVVSSNEADSIILETNQPVMALGGFSGSDPILTTAQLAALVKNGTVRFFLLYGSDGGGPGGGQSALITWITQHTTAVPSSQWQSTSTSSGLGGASQLYEYAATS